MGEVEDLWDALIDWIRSRDPVSPYQETTTVCFLCWLRNHKNIYSVIQLVYAGIKY